MNLTISGHHLEVSPALREYVTAKLTRITRHFDQVVDAKVLLSVENRVSYIKKWSLEDEKNSFVINILMYNRFF